MHNDPKQNLEAMTAHGGLAGREKMLPGRLAWLPIPVLLLAAAALRMAGLRTPYEPPSLLAGLNLYFSLPVALLIAFLTGRDFLARALPGPPLVGCGAILLGAAGLASTAVSGADPNLQETFNNTCAWLSGLCHLVGTAFAQCWRLPLWRPGRWLVVAYSATLGTLGLTVLATLSGWMPTFFVPAQGGTPVRQFALASGIVLFVLASALLHSADSPRRSPFAQWYSLALALMAAGLLARMGQSAQDDPLGWTSGVAQWLGGAYMLAAAVVSVRDPDLAGIAQKPVCGEAWHGYGVATALTIAAAVLHLVFLQVLGRQTTYVTFYPAVMFSALYGGLRAGLLAAALSAVFANYFWVESAGSFSIGHPSTWLATVIFMLSCTMISGLIEAMHRARARAAVAVAEASFAAEREQAAEALRESEARYRRLAELSPDAIFINLHDRVSYANPAFVSLLGAESLSQILGRSPYEFIHPDDHDHAHAHIQQVQCGETAPPLAETRFLKLDGTVVPVEVAAAPYPDASCLGVQVVAHDISVRKQREEILARQAAQLREQDRRKDEFLAMLGHELRNPLTPIMVAAQMLQKRGAEDPESVQWAADTVLHQCNTLTQLVNQLLDVSRVTQGKIRLRKSTVDLAQLIRQAAETTKPLLDEHRHTLELDLPSGPLMVDADPVRIEQVVGNLLHNAVKYTPDGGKIGISLALEEGMAVVRVRDSGIGIRAQVLPGVFDLFAQAEGAVERSQGGLGIGLALVKALVEMHGGRVEAHSAGEAQGSEFTLRLPLPPILPQTETPAPAALPSAATKVRRQVLVVDDNEAVLDSTTVLLKAMGHSVRTARNGFEALDIVNNAVDLDAVLLDIGMPGLNGYEVASRLRQNPALGKLTLIAVTGFGQNTDRRLARSAGFDHHLVKPFDTKELERILAGPE